MDADGWTAIPNQILDNMAKMRGSTFAICCVVARKTLGYSNGNGGRKEWDRISTSQFMAATGLTNRSVIDTVAKAIEDGWIERRKAGQSYEYRIKPMKKVHSLEPETYEESSQVEAQSYEESSQVDEPTYEKSSQAPMKKVHRSAPKPMKKVHTQKKVTTKQTSKESTDTDVSAANAEPEPTEQQKMFGKICDIVGWDYNTLDAASKGQVAQTLGIFQKADYTLADLNRFGPEVWIKDWRWQRHKRHPTIKELRQEIGKLRAEQDGNFTEGKPNEISQRSDGRDDQGLTPEQAAELRAALRQSHSSRAHH